MSSGVNTAVASSINPAKRDRADARTGALLRWTDSFRRFPSKEDVRGSDQPSVASTASACPQERRRTGELAAYVAAGTRFEGDLHYTGGTAHIDGEVLGRVDAEKASRVSLGPQAMIHGTILAPHVSIHGHVRGDIVATSSVVVREGAYVLGDIYCRQVAIEAGAVVVGRLLQNGERPPSSVPATDAVPVDTAVGTQKAELVDVEKTGTSQSTRGDLERASCTQVNTGDGSGQIGANDSREKLKDSMPKQVTRSPALQEAAVRLFLKKLF